MKKNIILSLLLLMISFTGIAFSAEIGGVTFDETVKIGDAQLVLNGVGLRKKFGFKVYAVGMFLKAKSADNAKIIAADEPMCMKMKYRRNAPIRKIVSVFYDSFAEVLKLPKEDDFNETSEYGAITKEVRMFMKAIANGKVSKGDIHTLNYVPGKGVEISIEAKDRKGLQVTVPGLAFKKALFSIWIGEEPPVGNKLKNQLLGK